MDSPYRNQYGEIVGKDEKRPDIYVLDEAYLHQIKSSYSQHKIANEIVQGRTNPD